MSSAHIIYIAFTLLLGAMFGVYAGRRAAALGHDDAERRLRLRKQQAEASSNDDGKQDPSS